MYPIPVLLKNMAEMAADRTPIRESFILHPVYLPLRVPDHGYRVLEWLEDIDFKPHTIEISSKIL